MACNGNLYTTSQSFPPHDRGHGSGQQEQEIVTEQVSDSCFIAQPQTITVSSNQPSSEQDRTAEAIDWEAVGRILSGLPPVDYGHYATDHYSVPSFQHDEDSTIQEVQNWSGGDTSANIHNYWLGGNYMAAASSYETATYGSVPQHPTYWQTALVSQRSTLSSSSSNNQLPGASRYGGVDQIGAGVDYPTYDGQS
ncbi:hypothetical protein V5O48_013188 [Marasmius crinis-equi]|uniref:Uncharacterized protein n=1 Tax=Marasmius crinis-equi TaxID=585013 RepID=A0ABR3F0W9_9AGAR